MGTITLREVGLTVGTPLFSHLNLSIGSGDRVGLIAGNGRGKTSLLRMLAGDAEPSAGDIVRSRGLKAVLVDQEVSPEFRERNARDVVLSGLDPIHRDFDSWRVDVVLESLSVPEASRDLPLSALSGGWQRMVLIARAMVSEPDVLLLDEPTNHLDLERMLDLENWILNVEPTLPMVISSHDRRFLDSVTNRTMFLRPETSHVFSLPYSPARAALDELDRAEEAKQQKDLKAAKKLRRSAADLYNVGVNSGSDLLLTKAKQLKARAGAIEAAQKSLHQERAGDIKLTNSGTQAKVLLALENVVVDNGVGDALFRVPKLHVFQSDRIVLLGRNGAGKTRLVTRISQAIGGADLPGFWVTPSLVLGYADQAMSQLPTGQKCFDWLNRNFDVADQKGRALLAAAGLSVEQQNRPIGELSPGQRARLGLLGLRLKAPNFYVLDEPTNHVDIAGCERLEEEIIESQAGCILISHDRAFVEAVGTRFLMIERGRLVECESPKRFYDSLGR
ncbi:ABC transporter [Devosia pacifica]|uniref:ABC transporter n=1 Tax=Devosia pacifica TaxID=1335967 RepID=A0A918VMF2_9HYPH|nr:ABC-F family ATP-binding cassette domain-containing protein [Devosia pacifica]GHA10399.1 ABC transporter [Devosia pacifica]